MISVLEAKNKILDSFYSLNSETINIDNSLNRTLAEPIIADLASPSFDNSSMDGIAVLSSDVKNAKPEHPITLQLIGSIPAGEKPRKHVLSGQAMQIMTGAPVPVGTDTVIQVEHTDLDYSAPVTKNYVLVYHPAPPGSNIRKKGEFFNAGDQLLSPGQVLRPQDIATIAMVGKPKIKVIRQPKVGLLTTGDELVNPGDSISPGKIRDTNSFMLSALLEANGAAVFRSGIVQDTEESVLEALDNLLRANVDLLLTSGGVSMGAYDVVRQVLEEHGKLKLWRVNMRPGKPLAFGEYRNIPFIGLPGNPVSAFVGFHIFVKPVLNKMLGVSYKSPSTQKAKLLHSVTSDGRETYIPALLYLQGGEWVTSPAKNQSSGNLFALIPGNSLIILPIGVKFLNKGETVDVLKLDLG